MVGDRILNSGFVLVLALGAYAALSGCNSAAQNQRPAEPPPQGVVITQVVATDVRVMSEYPAQTYARNTVEVRGRVDGYIDKWLFHPGQEVHAGDVLYVLDLRPYEAAVEQAKGNLSQSEADLEFARKQVALLQAEANLAAAEANLLKAQQDYERLTPLVKADAAAQQELDTAVAALHAGEATVRANKANVDQTRLSTSTQISSTEGKMEAQRGALRTASLNLEYATIRAPISGLIGDTLVPVGGLVNANAQMPLTTIVPLDPIWVRFKVTESQYLSFKKNPTLLQSPLALILADNTQFPQKGRIENTLNQVDPKTGTLELQASFPNPAAHVAAGTIRQGPRGDRAAPQRDPGSATRHPATAKRANSADRGRRQCSRTPPHHHSRTGGRELDRSTGAESGRSRHRRRAAQGAAGRARNTHAVSPLERR